MPTATEAEILQNNEIFFSALEAGGSYEKTAADAINDYTRYRIREGGVLRAVLPPIPLQDSDLDRVVSDPRPAKIIDMEPDSPAAKMISFRNLPDQYFMTGRRYMVLSERVLSPWFQADIEELRTNTADIRQIMSDNALKDMQTAEDACFFGGVDSILIGPEQIQPFSQTVQWRKSAGSISRNSLIEMTKILPSTPGRLNATKVVTNNITIKELLKLPFNEIGGDWSQELLKNGWTESDLLGMKLFITIKQDIVPNGTFYLFADPKFMGKCFEYTPTTMFVERKAFLLSYFAHETLGLTIANPFSIGRQDYQI